MECLCLEVEYQGVQFPGPESAPARLPRMRPGDCTASHVGKARMIPGTAAAEASNMTVNPPSTCRESWGSQVLPYGMPMGCSSSACFTLCWIVDPFLFNYWKHEEFNQSVRF